MNQKIILIVFLILGLSVVEWGCNDNYPKGNAESFLVDIIDIMRWKPINHSHWLPVKDTINSDSLGFKLELQTKSIVTNSSSWSNTAVLAEDPVEPAIPYTKWRLDSIELYNMHGDTEALINDQFLLFTDRSLNLTTEFNTQNANDILFPEGRSFNLLFKWNDTLTMPLDLALKVNIYGSDSTFFSSTASKIIVIP